MKKLCIAILVGLLIPAALCAEEVKPNSLFDLQIENGGFGEVSLKLQKIEKLTTGVFDLKGGWIINHHFYLGGSVSLATRDMHDFYSISWGIPQNVIFGYLGPQIGVFINPSDLIVFEISMLMGYGGVSYSYEHFQTGDGFMVYEPAIGVNINLFDFLRVCLSASYIICDRVSMPYAVSDDFNGFCFRLGAKLGKF